MVRLVRQASQDRAETCVPSSLRFAAVHKLWRERKDRQTTPHARGCSENTPIQSTGAPTAQATATRCRRRWDLQQDIPSGGRWTKQRGRANGGHGDFIVPPEDGGCQTGRRYRAGSRAAGLALHGSLQPRLASTRSCSSRSKRPSATSRAFSHRLVAAGKPGKLALTACMSKLLTILNAMMRTNTTWRRRAPGGCRSGRSACPNRVPSDVGRHCTWLPHTWLPHGARRDSPESRS